MVKLVCLYTHPSDKESFDQHYAEVHMPLVRQVPDLARVEVSHVTSSPRGPSPYYLIAELYWENVEAMNASLSSPEMRAVGKDARTFGDILTMHIAEIEN